jgi:hypothetical protein
MAVQAVEATAEGTRTWIGRLSESDLLRRSNRQLDELFRGSPAGDAPGGDLDGTAIAFPGTHLAVVLAKLAYWVAWQGKVTNASRTELKNKITPLRLRAIKAQIYPEASWVDGKPCVVLDYSKTSLVARMVRDEIRLVDIGLYLGVVWLRKHRVAWFTLRMKDET